MLQEVALEHHLPVQAHLHQAAHCLDLAIARCSVAPAAPLLEQSVVGVVGAEGLGARLLVREDDGGERGDDGDGAAAVYAFSSLFGDLGAVCGRGSSGEGSRVQQRMQQRVLEQAGRGLGELEKLAVRR